jgi:hypothetical protein
MKSGIKSLFVLAFPLFTGMASAAPIQISNGAYAAVTVRDCRTADARAAGSMTPNRCNDYNGTEMAGTIVDQRFNTQYGGVKASVRTHNPLGSGTQGYIDASGAAGALVLKQAAFTNTPYARVSTQAVALQSFTWDGNGDSNRAIGGHLHFDATYLKEPNAFGPREAGSRVLATISVFSLASNSFSYEPVFNNQPNFTYAASGRTDYHYEGGDAYQWTTDPLDWKIDFAMEKDRTYFVEAYFSMWAKFGAHVDAMNTFKASVGSTGADGNFVADTQGLRFAAPLAAPTTFSNDVPEPSTIALFAIALAGIARCGGRRRV